jgi:hypothetical protein
MAPRKPKNRPNIPEKKLPRRGKRIRSKYIIKSFFFIDNITFFLLFFLFYKKNNKKNEMVRALPRLPFEKEIIFELS